MEPIHQFQISKYVSPKQDRFILVNMMVLISFLSKLFCEQAEFQLEVLDFLL